MILAIVGSRTFSDKQVLDETLESFLARHGAVPERVVSGGAAGADTLGEAWARQRGIPVTVFKSCWRKDGKYNPRAGLDRNTDIVQECTHMVAFPSHNGRGTQDSIRKAEAKVGKDRVEVKWID